MKLNNFAESHNKKQLIVTHVIFEKNIAALQLVKNYMIILRFNLMAINVVVDSSL